MRGMGITEGFAAVAWWNLHSPTGRVASVGLPALDSGALWVVVVAVGGGGVVRWRGGTGGAAAQARSSAGTPPAPTGATVRSRAAARPTSNCGTSSARSTNSAGVHEPVMS